MEPSQTPALGLTPRDLARAAVRGLAVTLLLGLVWLLVPRLVLGVERTTGPLVFLYGALLGAVAAPLAVGEAWARSRPRPAPTILALGLVALLWYWLAGSQLAYAEEMRSSGDAARALEAVRSSLAARLSLPPRFLFLQLLGAFAFAPPFALSAWGRLRGDPLGWQVARTVAGTAGLSGAALHVQAASLSPVAVPTELQLPLHLTLASAALGLPLLDAGLDRLFSTPAASAQPPGAGVTRRPFTQVAVLFAMGPLAFGAVQAQRWFAERAAAAARAAKEAAIAAEAQRLSELLDAGELPASRLRLAAHLGDPAAAQTLGAGAPPSPERWTAWREGVEEHGGVPACRRAALALARATLRPYAEAKPGDLSLEKALAKASDQVACPCPPHRLAADEARRGLVVPRASQAKGASYWSPKAVEAALRAATSQDPSIYLITAVHAAEAVRRSDRRLRREVRDEVVPWALGRHDPLAPNGQD
jgi:hypothetical protein